MRPCLEKSGVIRKRPLENIVGKEEIPITIFSFSHSVFYSMNDKFSV